MLPLHSVILDGITNSRVCFLIIADLPLGTSIEMTPSNTTVLRSSTVTLNCSTDANPAAHVYQFYFNDSFISNSSSGLLNITVDTDGVYTCVPINKVGTGHNANVSITMVGKSLVFFSMSVLGFVSVKCYSQI